MTTGARETALPELVVLDVNETLSDMSVMGSAFAEVGLEPAAAEAWFAGVLRDAFALTVLGDNPAFADIAKANLRGRLAAAGVEEQEPAVATVMERFLSLELHPDVVPGLLALADRGCRIVTLSNGSADVARGLLAETPAGPVIEAYLSVADARLWKPARSAYAHALDQTGVAAGDAMLVAVHPWDVGGAKRAGLRAAWIDRTGGPYPDHFDAPDVVARDFEELAGM